MDLGGNFWSNAPLVRCVARGARRSQILNCPAYHRARGSVEFRRMSRPSTLARVEEAYASFETLGSCAKRSRVRQARSSVAFRVKEAPFGGTP